MGQLLTHYFPQLLQLSPRVGTSEILDPKFDLGRGVWGMGRRLNRICHSSK